MRELELKLEQHQQLIEHPVDRETSSSASSGSVPTISASSFTNDFSAMAALKPLAAAGKGAVAAILPDTTTSTRYVEFDEP